MRIVWNKNPLRQTFELTEADREIFRLKAKLADYEFAIADAERHLDPGPSGTKRVDPARALEALRDAESETMSSAALVEAMLRELEEGWHVGDCTCVSASCMRCAAEEILGTSTIEGLRKHPAAYVAGAFGPDNSATLDEAIRALDGYEPIRDGPWLDCPQDEFDRHAARWRADHERARDWLLRHRAERLA